MPSIVYCICFVFVSVALCFNDKIVARCGTQTFEFYYIMVCWLHSLRLLVKWFVVIGIVHRRTHKRLNRITPNGWGCDSSLIESDFYQVECVSAKFSARFSECGAGICALVLRNQILWVNEEKNTVLRKRGKGCESSTRKPFSQATLQSHP